MGDGAADPEGHAMREAFRLAERELAEEREQPRRPPR